jgi:O-antigen/teichoic acid export membrane protein
MTPAAGMRPVKSLLFPPASQGAPSARVAGSFFYTVAGVVCQGIARFAFSLMVGHAAGKTVLGHANLVIALATFLVLCWPQSTATAVSKYVAMARGHDDGDAQLSATSFTARLALAGSLALAVLAFAVARVLLSIPAGQAGLGALLVVALGTYTYVRGLRYGNSHFATGAAWDLLSSAAALALLGVLLLGHHVTWVLAPLVLGNVAGTLAGWPRRHAPPDPSVRREIRHFVLWNSAQVVAAGGLLQLVLLLASPFATDAQLGDFAAAVSLATPLVLVSIALRTSMAPSIASAYASGDRAEARRRVDRIMRLMVVVFLPAFGIGIVWADQVLTVTYGSQFRSAHTLLVLLLLGVSVNSFNAAHVWLISTEPGGVRTLAGCNAAGLVTGLTVAVAASPHLGVRGAALGYLAGSTVSSLAAAAAVWRRECMRWGAPSVRLAVGYALVVIAAVTVPDGMALASRIGITAAFLAGWTVLNWSDIIDLVRPAARG